MLIGINGATTMPASLETDIAVAGKAGYDLVEIRTTKLDHFLDSHGTSDVAALLAAAGVSAFALNAIEHVNLRSAADYEAIKQDCRRYCAIAHDLRCPNIVVVPSPTPVELAWPQIRADAIAVLRELSGIAQPFGVQLAFEFLGAPGCSVSTLAQAWDIVQGVDRANVGMVLDTFHFYAGGSTLESIMDIDANKLFIFHINDVEKGERTKLTDAQRLMPGEGVIPLGDICRGLRNAGYKKMVSIELFRPEYWAWDPLKLAVAAKAATEAIVNDIWAA
jgi:2-keto-myo-inositol isomerase